MEDEKQQRDRRTKRLRDRIAERSQPDQSGGSRSADHDDAPREGESYLAFTERRMRETIRKKPE